MNAGLSTGRSRNATVLSISRTICSLAPRTWTTNRAVAVLPAASVALHATVVSPIGKTLPDAGVQTRLGDWSRSSFAEAE